MSLKVVCAAESVTRFCRGRDDDCTAPRAAGASQCDHNGAV